MDWGLHCSRATSEDRNGEADQTFRSNGTALHACSTAQVELHQDPQDEVPEVGPEAFSSLKGLEELCTCPITHVRSCYPFVDDSKAMSLKIVQRAN